MGERKKRYARLYSDGALSVEQFGVDQAEARRRLCIDDDDDTELLEVEIVIVRSFGKPKLQVVKEHEAICPTCGEQFYVECHNLPAEPRDRHDKP